MLVIAGLLVGLLVGIPLAFRVSTYRVGVGLLLVCVAICAVIMFGRIHL